MTGGVHENSADGVNGRLDHGEGMALAQQVCSERKRWMSRGSSSSVSAVMRSASMERCPLADARRELHRENAGLGEWSGPAQIQCQMMAIELQALAKIQPVSRVPGVAGVQVQALATGGLGVGDQPIHERAGETP